MVDFVWLLVMLSGWVATFLVARVAIIDADYWITANRKNRDLYWAEQEKVKCLERQIEKVYSVIVKPGKN